MPGRPASSSLLRGGAAVAAGDALAADAAFGDHPVHTLVLAAVVAVVAGTVCAHLIRLLVAVVRRPQAMSGAPFAPVHLLISVRAERLGSMRRWCGWVLQAARRGPPSLAGYGVPRTT
jgi:hypothetical protein